jgi:hypothetical protein
LISNTTVTTTQNWIPSPYQEVFGHVYYESLLKIWPANTQQIFNQAPGCRLPLIPLPHVVLLQLNVSLQGTLYVMHFHQFHPVHRYMIWIGPRSTQPRTRTNDAEKRTNSQNLPKYRPMPLLPITPKQQMRRTLNIELIVNE